MANAYLIRVPKQKDRFRAREVLGKVPFARCGFTDFRWLVTAQHVEALKEAGIPFEDLTDLPWDETALKKKPRKAKPRKAS